MSDSTHIFIHRAWGSVVVVVVVVVVSLCVGEGGGAVATMLYGMCLLLCPTAIYRLFVRQIDIFGKGH